MNWDLQLKPWDKGPKKGKNPSNPRLLTAGHPYLPDIYAQSPRAVDIHIRQITSAHVTAISGKADSLNANMSVITELFLCACLKDSIMVRCG